MAQQVTNPIPAPIVKGNVRIRIDNLVQMPNTAGTLGKPDNSPGARARINFLRESPDGRLFVNDLRGQLYTLDANHQPQLYLDIDAANGGGGSIFPDTLFDNGLAAGFVSFNFIPSFSRMATFTRSTWSAHAGYARGSGFRDGRRANWRPSGKMAHVIVTEWTTPNAARQHME